MNDLAQLKVRDEEEKDESEEISMVKSASPLKNSGKYKISFSAQDSSSPSPKMSPLK
jgi:hypothetical protein